MFFIVMSVPLLLLTGLIEERSKGATTQREREERISLAAESANLAFWSINFERKGPAFVAPSHFYSTKPNGMGMGLTIVRSIVEAHGGKLRAENVDEGARFFFTLPVTRKPETREVA
jgi:C4-dicarboxylate-specific signal transduction histidine kinase